MTVATKVTVAAVVLVSFVAHGRSQSGVTDTDLESASGGRVVRVGPAIGGDSGAAGDSVGTWPLEVYVARVLAGEAEPEAADVAFEALAVAIRTFALANADRHSRDGFDLCDGTHCQVPRAATAKTRRAAMATAAQILTWNGAPAEVFYSASCGGYSESADQVWPEADYPYMRSAPDEVHDEDQPWTVALTLQDVQRALVGAGFLGRLSDVEVDARSPSGRATRLRLAGLQPAVIAGDRFRAVIGGVRLRSTAFSIDRRGTTLHFTGRGYGHGVGMCVIGAGRRAARGESVRAILAQYYPGLEVTRLAGVGVSGVGVDTTVMPPASLPSAVLPETGRGGRDGIVVDVPRSSGMTDIEVARLTADAHEDLANVLGTSVAPITVRVHESLESFRLATGRPWVGAQRVGRHLDRPGARRAPRAAGRLRRGAPDCRRGVARVRGIERASGLGSRGRGALLRAQYAAPHTGRRGRGALPVGRGAHAGDFRRCPARRGGAGRSLLRARVRENARLARRALSTRPASPPAFGCRSFGCCCGCVGVCRVGVCRRRDPEIALAQGGRVVARLSQRAEPAAQTGMPVAVSLDILVVS